jgi:hypothetical protein
MAVSPRATDDSFTMRARLAVAVATLLAAAGMWAWPVAAYDAGIAPSSATFILHGAVPYRDFWYLYGPLSGYAIAIPTLVFGPSLLLLRVVGMVGVVVQAILGLELLGTGVPPILGLTIALGSAVIPLLVPGPDPTAWSIAMIFATAALVAAARARATRGELAAGVLAGIAFLARLDVGAYALLACLVMVRSRWPLVGFVPVAGPVVLAVLALVPLPALYEQLIWYPIAGPRLFRPYSIALDLGSAPNAIGLVENLAVRGTLIVVFAARVLGRLTDRQSTGLLVFAALCQLQTLGRGDLYHVAQASGPAVLLIGVATARAAPWLQRTATSLVLVGVGVSAALGLALVTAPPSAYIGAVLDAASFVAHETAPTEPIFVGLTDNRFTFSNPLIAYYLADRRAGTRYTMYNPGVTNTDATQTLMASELEASGTRYLILDRENAGTRDAGLGAVPGSTILDTYIAEHFVVARNLGPIVVMVRTTP